MKARKTIEKLTNTKSWFSERSFELLNFSPGHGRKEVAQIQQQTQGGLSLLTL
jgi:hypothetical protein